MIGLKDTVYKVDTANKKIYVSREFDAPVKEVWQAWTDSTMLDQWWGPKPWNAITQSMNFKEKGKWMYYMQGPDGTKHYCSFDYDKIEPNKSYSGIDAFCDENGRVLTEMPRLNWKVNFSPAGDATKVEIEITSDSADAISKIVEMGFKEGFAQGHKQLDELLAKS